MKNLGKTVLLERFGKLVASERKMTNLVLEYLAEIDRRRLYLDLGFANLFEYLTQAHHYSPSAAMRRIDGCRLLQQVPELSEKIETGKINLSQTTTLQKAVREAEKVGAQIDVDQKRSLLKKIEGATSAQTEVILQNELGIDFPRPAPLTIHHRDQSVSVSLNLSQEEAELVKQATDLASHAVPSGDVKDLLLYLVRRFTESKKSTTASVVNPRQKTVAPALRRKLLEKANHRCEFVSSGNHRCTATRFLQIDHLQPKWAGGANSEGNLRVLCAQHNRHRYRHQAGVRRAG